MDANQFLTKIYAQIDVIVRKATKEAVEDALKIKTSTENSKDEDFLSAPEAANFLKIKLNTLYSKVEKGEVSHYRSGKRKLLFSKKELSNFIASRKGKSNTEIAEEVDRYFLQKRL